MKRQLILSILVFCVALCLSSVIFDSKDSIASAAGPEFLSKTIDGEGVSSFDGSYDKQARPAAALKLN